MRYAPSSLAAFTTTLSASQGQKVSVNYHEIVAANSVELMVLDNLRGKMDVADFVRSMVAKGADPANLI